MFQKVCPNLTGAMCIVAGLLALVSCNTQRREEEGLEDVVASAASPEKALQALTQALTLHASFDDGPDAAFARGDRRLYTAPSYAEQAQAVAGLGNPNVEIAEDGGRSGGALKFSSKNTHAIFYPAGKNVGFANGEWNGTISFWLSLDPDQDLEPGYCDPIQVTDSAYNDAAIWVDFTRDDTPRHFRLGVFGDLKSWNPDNLPPDENQAFLERLVVVTEPPFERGRWTHVVVTFSGLNSGQGGRSRLYLDGRLQGESPRISEPFTWDLEKGAVRLGVNYVGLFDDLSLFDRPLTEAEVQTLYGLADIAAAIVPRVEGRPFASEK